jgi:hypothetical protein
MKTTTLLFTAALAATTCFACGGMEPETDIATSESELSTGLRVVRTDYDRRAGSTLIEVRTNTGVFEGAGVSPFLRASGSYNTRSGWWRGQSETLLADADITAIGRDEVSIILWLDGPLPTSGIRSSVELVGANPTPHP